MYNHMYVYMCAHVYGMYIYISVFISVNTHIITQVNVCVFVSMGQCMGKIEYPVCV